MKIPTLTPADALTMVRLAAVPILWVLAAKGMTLALGIVLAIAGLTDVLDGPIARRTGRSSPFGSQLDSLADVLLMGSVVLWMLWLHPDFFRTNAWPLLAWVVIGFSSLVATMIKFGRLGDLHLYSAKAAGVVGYVFVVWLFTLGGYSQTFFHLTIGLAILASTETLLVALLRDRADPSTRSIFDRT